MFVIFLDCVFLVYFLKNTIFIFVCVFGFIKNLMTWNYFVAGGGNFYAIIIFLFICLYVKCFCNFCKCLVILIRLFLKVYNI